MKKYKRGYTQGVFDMFHVGHLNLINHAKNQCETLVVGVNADKLVESYKNKKTVIPEEERALIVQNIKAVDDVVIAETLDKEIQLKKVDFDAIFIGDDWKGDSRWLQTEKDLAKYNVDVVYLPRTKGVCSTGLRKVETNRIEG
ncbi:glycerol-3-phosphate cytidylyltransferase [Lactobacillus sp. CBA3605]|uniref:adenylyltransferase/cytidyltransferase family protein n=1 Tax=Lactobacillus sp. CBA3605 TaxID=2099788 RepID=UPI000CFC4883|nr:adenylyltransferase/cytidyltransferase family protein [Lactobacillus sp. CBA3605]AVK62240.1 glycerol-3-phosphate cytidylyltransferase [Lactobacillus sp. CBA3605]